jgi:hypothetical protein
VRISSFNAGLAHGEATTSEEMERSMIRVARQGAPSRILETAGIAELGSL